MSEEVIRVTRVWRNPFTGEAEVILKTPLGGGGWHMGGVGVIKMGGIRFYPDARGRLERSSLTEENILGDVRAWVDSEASKRGRDKLPG